MMNDDMTPITLHGSIRPAGLVRRGVGWAVVYFCVSLAYSFQNVKSMALKVVEVKFLKDFGYLVSIHADSFWNVLQAIHFFVREVLLQSSHVCRKAEKSRGKNSRNRKGYRKAGIHDRVVSRVE